MIISVKVTGSNGKTSLDLSINVFQGLAAVPTEDGCAV